MKTGAALVAIVLTFQASACATSSEPAETPTPSASASASVVPSPTPQTKAEAARVALRDAGYLVLGSVQDKYLNTEGRVDCAAAKTTPVPVMGRELARNVNERADLPTKLTPEDGVRIVEIILRAYCPEALGT